MRKNTRTKQPQQSTSQKSVRLVRLNLSLSMSPRTKKDTKHANPEPTTKRQQKKHPTPKPETAKAPRNTYLNPKPFIPESNTPNQSSSRKSETSTLCGLLWPSRGLVFMGSYKSDICMETKILTPFGDLYPHFFLQLNLQTGKPQIHTEICSWNTNTD